MESSAGVLLADRSRKRKWARRSLPLLRRNVALTFGGLVGILFLRGIGVQYPVWLFGLTVTLSVVSVVIASPVMMMEGSPWIFNMDYWLELYQQPPPEPTFGATIVKRPFDIAKRLVTWILTTVVAATIVLDVQDLAASSDASLQLNPFLWSVARVLVPFGLWIFLIGFLASLPFRVRRVYRSNPTFVTRHGVRLGSIWGLSAASYALAVVALCGFGYLVKLS